MKMKKHIIAIIVVLVIYGKEGCIHMRDDGLCGKNPAATSSGEYEAPCSYYESINSVDWCIIVAYNISTINSTVLSTERDGYDRDKTNGCESKYKKVF